MPDLPNPEDDEPIRYADGTHDFGKPFARNSLPRFLIRHALVGKAVGLCLTGLLIWFNVGGLGDLIGQSRDGYLAVIILTVSMMGLMGGLSVATGIYLFYAKEPEDDSSGRSSES